MRHHAKIVMSGLLLSLCLVSLAAAQDVDPSVTFWQGPSGVEASWFDIANWSAGVPTGRITAYINNGGIAAIGPSPSAIGAVAANLHLGGHRGGHIHQAAGRLAVEGATWMGPIGYGLPTPDIYPGPNGPAGGTYRLDEGLFTSTALFMGAGRPYYLDDGTRDGREGSVFTQTHGNVAIGKAMHVGYAPLLIARDGTVREPTGTCLDPDYLCRPGAQYNLNGGTLKAPVARVGYGGKGRITQRGGLAAFERDLFIGGGQLHVSPLSTDPTRPTATDLATWPGYYDGGEYHLADGDLAAGAIHVGQRGRGLMAQSGGTVKTEHLQVGANWAWYPVNATDDATAAMEAGVVPEVVLPAIGTYRLGGDGALATATTEIGLGGTGHFLQDGGAHRVAGTLRIGHNRYWVHTDPRIMTADEIITPTPYPIPSNGRYTLIDGLVEAGRLELGAGYDAYPADALTADPRTATDAQWAPIPWRPATFAQNGGSVAIDRSLNIYGGGYRLTDGSLKARTMRLTDGVADGPSAFVQHGGEAAISGAITLGSPVTTLSDGTAVLEENPDFAPRYGPSRLALHDGRLTAESVRLIGPGPATLVQTGGAMNVRGDLAVAGGQSEASLVGGWLNVPRLTVGRNVVSPEVRPRNHLHLGRGATVTVSDHLHLGGDATYGADAGADVLMSGADFHNTSVRSDALAGLFNTEMTFVTGPTDDNSFETYEVAGKDLGFTRAGFWRNFVMDSLVVGTTDWSRVRDIGTLQLVDRFDNQPQFEKPEALYVHKLVVGPDSILDLNGLNLYALGMKIHPDAKIIGELPALVDAVELTLPGDSDMDGDVDLDDFVALKRGFGAAARVHWGHGDYDGNGRVDLDDFVALKRNFGAAAVPEPGTLALLTIGAVALRRRR
ncbi:MAG: PEP-CTERM sorting domain-containing protein [Planctomycetota bacterium]